MIRFVEFICMPKANDVRWTIPKPCQYPTSQYAKEKPQPVCRLALKGGWPNLVYQLCFAPRRGPNLVYQPCSVGKMLSELASKSRLPDVFCTPTPANLVCHSCFAPKRGLHWPPNLGSHSRFAAKRTLNWLPNLSYHSCFAAKRGLSWPPNISYHSCFAIKWVWNGSEM